MMTADMSLVCDGELYDRDDALVAAIEEEFALPDYVVMSDGQRCYLGTDCDPEYDVCFCGCEEG